MPDVIPVPELEYVFSIRLTLDHRLSSPIMLSGKSHGSTTAMGGEITGPRLTGTVIPLSGSDSSSVRPDGVVSLDARYLLRSQDGVMIWIHNQGIRDGSPQVAQGVDPGVVVDQESWDLRVSPIFDAPPGDYDWMTRSTFVGIGKKLPDGQGNQNHYYRVNPPTN